MEIEAGLARIASLEDELGELQAAVLKAHEGDFYPMDFLAVAASNRCVAHAAGFRHLIRERNLVCAGAILRLQIDTAARFSAAWHVANPHDFALEVLRGAHIRDLRAQDGNRLTDRYLVQQLVPEAEWIERVYEKTSGYIHFSDTHIFAAVHSADGEARSLHMKVSPVDRELPDELYEEAIEAFIAATQLFMRYLHGWGFTKENPEVTMPRSGD